LEISLPQEIKDVWDANIEALRIVQNNYEDVRAQLLEAHHFLEELYSMLVADPERMWTDHDFKDLMMQVKAYLDEVHAAK
jgi:hypothetical protein